MHVALSWLAELVDIQGLTPESIADALTGSGLEVEGIERQGARFTDVVVAKCQKLDPHPNADKLRLATVNLGSKQQQVVCGAQNLAEGMLIAFALEGAQVISRKDGSLFTLGKATIRGVESSGMICSIDELGLQDQYPKTEDGIWPLASVASEADLGKDLKSVLGLTDETVLETAPTANRGDLMSMVGVAKEVAALFNRELKLPTIQAYDPGKSTMKINLPEPEASSYYGGLSFKNLKIGPSPAWLSQRLQAAGVRSISNVVDITNYVMLELGQPLHAFDAEKLGTGTIAVRHAKAGEQLKTLDGVDRPLTTEALLITKDDQPIALAGLMGGETTEIDDNSTTLFLEAAVFDSAQNRRSAKSVGLRSEANARFERGVTVENCRQALFRAGRLIEKLSGASFEGFVESDVPKFDAPKITMRLKRLEQIIGIPFEMKDVQTVFEKLGFGIVNVAADSIEVSVPAYRQTDVTREIDLIEEVIRIHGYNKVQYTLPRKTASVPFSQRASLIDNLHNTLSTSGLQEVFTTSLIGESLLKKTGFSLDEKQLVAVTNSHSSDHTLMRQSLLPNLLEVAKFNQANNIDSVWIYELGRTYFKVAQPQTKQSGVSEKLMAAGLVTGPHLTGGWQNNPAPDFYTVKGILEQTLQRTLRTEDFTFEPLTDVSYLHPGKSAKVSYQKRELGFIGELHPARQATLKFAKPVYLFELNVETLYKLVKQQPAIQPPEAISPYPAVRRDLALLVPMKLTHREILAVIENAKEPLLKSVELFDEFKGEKLGPDQRSLAYRLTFQSESETLTDPVIEKAVTHIKDALAKQLSIGLR